MPQGQSHRNRTINGKTNTIMNMTKQDLYLEVCRKAAEDNKVFDLFKSHPDYRHVLEHVSTELGEKYLKDIRKNAPDLVDNIDIFKENDVLGKPILSKYPDVGDISPTTLRYVHTLMLLTRFFQLKDVDKVVEIGGGYGGQCYVLSCVSDFAKYTIVDLPEAGKLQRKYINKIGVKGVSIMSSENLRKTESDLFISNYAFSEIPKSYQEKYIEKFILHAERGFMIFQTKASAIPAEEIAKLMNAEILPENPQSHRRLENKMIVWGFNGVK